MSDLRSTLEAARLAGVAVAALPPADRRALLEDLAAAFSDRKEQEVLLQVNAQDMEAARAAQARGALEPALVKRLALDKSKLAALVDGLSQMARATEVVGQVTTKRLLDEGLVLERITCPLGVLGVVFEARPEALVQIVGLALKSGNAVLLKGGKEALASNRALTSVVHKVLARHGLDTRAVVHIEDRAGVAEVLRQHDLVDMMIARGSASFIRYVRANTKIPVMAHADGICHVYLHANADPAMAAPLLVDSKTSYPAACNAVETLLWDAAAGSALDASVVALRAAGVELRGCAATVARHPDMKLASEADWSTEYSALTLSIRQVADISGAMAHIARYGSRHTDVIVTADQDAAARFLAQVDTACCFHNASTRFSDGYRFGLGAEVGISTDKLHARGPVGVEGLVIYRWILKGQGQITADYGSGQESDKKAFLHRDL